MFYSGIGSRKTTKEILIKFGNIGKFLAKKNLF